MMKMKRMSDLASRTLIELALLKRRGKCGKYLLLNFVSRVNRFWHRLKK